MEVQDMLERTQEAADDDHWIGPPPSMTQIVAFLAIGSIALLIAGVQPILFDAMVIERRLTPAGLGWAMTVEFITLGLSAGWAGAVFRPTHLRLRAIAAAAVVVLMDGLIAHQSGLGILADRAVAGLGEGVMVWLTSLMITRSATPARWGGIFLVAQGAIQVVFAGVLPQTLMKTMGANGGFFVLAAAALLAGIIAAALPNAMQALPGADKDGAGKPPSLPLAAIASLAAVFLVFAFIIGFVAYLPQIMGESGLTQEQIGIAVSVSLATQIGGSVLAAVVARRIPYYASFVVCFIGFLAVNAVVATEPAYPLFLAAAAVYGIGSGFFMPFQLPFVIESDPSRRAAQIVPGVQAAGAAAGPLLCSFFVTQYGGRGALAVSSVCLTTAFAIATVLHLRRMGRSSKPAEVAVDLVP